MPRIPLVLDLPARMQPLPPTPALWGRLGFLSGESKALSPQSERERAGLWLTARGRLGEGGAWL